MGRLGIYVQVPFCQTKCTYCNFHTGVVSTSRFAPYAAAVCREISRHALLYEASGIKLPDAFAEAAVDTVYFGGGTPSLLEPAHLGDILDTLRKTFRCRFAEVTLEADPETIEHEKAVAWVAAGINRVSLGVQSFSDRELKAAGRMHRCADVDRGARILRAAGIGNISFDLIAGLPHQTAESWGNSLKELIALSPEHVSIYMMEIDEGSRLGLEVLQSGKRYSAEALPAEDQMADFYERGRIMLREAGYEHYEISNWAKHGFAALHNLKYWCREPYLGFGAGAHSFSGTQRWANAHDAAHYVTEMDTGKLPVEQLETLTSERALEEELFLGLRQLAGIDVARIEQQYGVTLAARFDPLAALGLLERVGSRVRLAPARLSVSNEVFVELMQ
ncbi:MAG TPA: radical SAM family heme chaperone HemW [Candidatus Eremiobacteraceae bacterium]|nr:radical SAM family heme chaperone HemW [Candidatus Eremiobacteraceae bacterium]